MSDTRVATRPYIVGGISSSFVVPATTTALGIGDVVAGASFYAGMRVYNTAKVGAQWGTAQRVSDSAQVNLFFKSNGYIDCSNVGGTGLTLSQWRDQVGASTLVCRFIIEQITTTTSGATAVPLNIVDEATGVLSLGSDTNTQELTFTITGFSHVAPFTLVGTGKHVTGGGNSAWVGSASGTTNWQLAVVPPNAAIYQDTAASPGFVARAFSEDTWHGVVGVANGASSSISVDGARTTGDTGSSAGITADLLHFGALTVSGNDFKGRYFEAAVYQSALSTTDQDKITTNITNMIASAGLT